MKTTNAKNLWNVIYIHNGCIDITRIYLEKPYTKKNI